MRSVDFVAFRWLIITHMENELFDDIWRQADSDSFIVWPGPATAALHTPSYIFSSQWKIPSSFNCTWGCTGRGWWDVYQEEDLSRHEPRTDTLHGVDFTCRRWWHVPRELGSPRNDTVSLVPRLFLSLSNLDSVLFFFSIFRSRNFRIFFNALREMFLFRSVYTQSVASFRENYQDHWISYTGDGKTNWTDYIKVEKDVNFKNFFYGGVEEGGVGHWRPSGGDNSSVFFFY